MMQGSSSIGMEIANLVISALIPLAVVGVGYMVSRATKRLESVQWANQTVIQRRLEIFGEVAPIVNRLLCFAIFVGGWKEIDPVTAVRLKRKADEIMYVNRVLFSPALFDAYVDFTLVLFDHYSRPGGDALLRVAISSRLGDRRLLGWWEDAMEQEFSTSDIPSFDHVQAVHDALSEQFRRDLHVTRTELSLTES